MAIEHNDQNSPDLERKTITIGVGTPLSGRAAALGREMSQAIQIAVDECNKGSGIFGALVTLDSADDAGKVELGQSVAGTLCAEENVRFYKKFGFAVIGEAAVIGVPNWFMSRPGLHALSPHDQTINRHPHP